MQSRSSQRATEGHKPGKTRANKTIKCRPIASAVRLCIGKTSNIGSVYEVKKALQYFDAHQTVDDLFIKAETGIDVKHEQNEHLLRKLMTNESIDVQWHGERVIFKRKPNLGIQDCSTLKQVIDSSWGGEKMTVRTKDLADTYRGVEKDVERLVEDGDVSSLHNTEDGSQIFFKRLHGTPASSCIKDLWNGVPKGHLLQDNLSREKF